MSYIHDTNLQDGDKNSNVSSSIADDVKMQISYADRILVNKIDLVSEPLVSIYFTCYKT